MPAAGPTAPPTDPSPPIHDPTRSIDPAGATRPTRPTDRAPATGASHARPACCATPSWARAAAPRRDDPAPELLAAREREIVLALAEGLSRDEVAVRIRRSRSTLDKAISQIYAVTGFRAAYQLVAWAQRCRLEAPAGGSAGDAATAGGAR